MVVHSLTRKKAENILKEVFARLIQQSSRGELGKKFESGFYAKPDPEIFLTAAKALGTTPAETLVLEDSYNGVRAGARGGFVTVMVPDLAPADDEMRSLYTAECKDLREVKKMLEEGKLLSEA